MRCKCPQSLAFRGPAPDRRHVGLDPGLINEDQPLGIKTCLPGSPALPLARDIGAGRPDPWTLSTNRAQLTRERLEAAGVADARIARVTGKADRDPVAETGDDSRNRRIEITLLRRFKR